MPFTHLFLALAVVFVWGTNFVVIKWGLADFPPFLFAALRFALCVLPWVFFVRRPPVAWRTLAMVGVLLGAGQFGLLYWAMQREISPGVASLVIQSQVFFTIGMSVVLSGERIRSLQFCALALAVCGYGIVAWRASTDPSATVTALGLATVLAAAFCWACANMLVRTAGRVNMLAFVVWSSLFSLPPVLALSLLLEGPALMMQSLSAAGTAGWLAVLWQAVGNSLFGFGAWNWLLARHPAATVLPTALLVPVFGLLSSALMLGESLPFWKQAVAVLVIGGLALNMWASRPPRG